MVNYSINDGNEILTRMWNNIISTGVVNRRLDSSRLGLILSAIATELNLTVSILESYVNQFSIDTCTDKILLEKMSRLFTVRRLKSKSKVMLTFYRIDDFAGSVKIPAGFAVMSQDNSQIVFKTISDTYLWQGSSETTVMAYSIGSGTINNVAENTLTIFQTNDYNTKIGVINKEPSFGANDDESLESVRGRASGFRYERDGTFLDIKRQMYHLGLTDDMWYSEEYSDGNGSYLISIDTNSQAQYEDCINALSYRKIYGIKQIFQKAQRVYVDIYITLHTTGDSDYTLIQKEQIYNTVENTVQKFFAAYCNVGTDLHANRIINELNKELIDYNFTSVDIHFGEVLYSEDGEELYNTNKEYIVDGNKLDYVYAEQYVPGILDDDTIAVHKLSKNNILRIDDITNKGLTGQVGVFYPNRVETNLIYREGD